jgi:hypothetical protein
VKSIEELPYPPGVHWDVNGTNFALFSATATKVEVCLFEESGERELSVVSNFPNTLTRFFTATFQISVWAHFFAIQEISAHIGRMFAGTFQRLPSSPLFIANTINIAAWNDDFRVQSSQEAEEQRARRAEA